MQRDVSDSNHTSRGLQPIAECGPYAALAKKASALEALDRALRQTLSSPLREQVRFANLREDRLVFLATSPAWASRLRLLQRQILDAARAIGVGASAIIVKVAPHPPAATVPEQSKPLSAAAALHLKAAASSISDPELRALFLQLASVAETADPDSDKST